MTQQIPLFEPTITMPHSDFRLFEACNNAPRSWYLKQEFFLLKDDLLKRYATEAGHDIQHIEDKCRSCDGKGYQSWLPHHRPCYACTNGIYQTRSFMLKRWILNGVLFYQPVGRLSGATLYNEAGYGAPAPKHTNIIKGHVFHPGPLIEPMYAYACLLSKYDKGGFERFCFGLGKGLNPTDWQRWGELSLKHDNFLCALAEYYGVGETDDLPF